ncbi:DUF1772 domain-containing protein [Comamonadaceae bacterium G21597-S1]|nr:DUF1772 domain-containing protein [Comamonadaceae bacterium G21597-S1]
MSTGTTVLVVAALLGSSMVGGIFFAFSSFIMGALARLPAPAAIAAMQSINVVVLNPSFLGLFMGTAAVSALLAARAWLHGGTTSAPWVFWGGVAYVVGTFLVTVLANVPLNNRLAAVSAPDPGAAPVWAHYLRRWVFFNTVRSAAATAAALCFAIGLIGGHHA